VLSFREGDLVKQGQLLFTLDRRPFEAALASAEANLLRDKALLTRPLEQEACDGLVEDLVRRRAGLGDEMVGAAEGHRPADRLGSIGVSPGVRRDEERTLGQRMEKARLVDDGVAAVPGAGRPASIRAMSAFSSASRSSSRNLTASVTHSIR
jgi:multidrug efflux pump subunit AcrA (membrane-fusion protein)